MENKIKVLLFAILALFTVVFTATKKNKNVNDQSRINIELLRASAQTEGSPPPNTGPRAIKDCTPAWKGSIGICQCTNSNACTDTSCF